jgi:hypothetical protein
VLITTECVAEEVLGARCHAQMLQACGSRLRDHELWCGTLYECVARQTRNEADVQGRSKHDGGGCAPYRNSCTEHSHHVRKDLITKGIQMGV